MNKQIDLSVKEYKKALDIYGKRRGGYGEQSILKSKIYSNLSEIYLQNKQYIESLESSSSALLIDPSFVKARFRRIRALLLLSNVSEAKIDIEKLNNLYIKSDDEKSMKLIKAYSKEATTLYNKKFKEVKDKIKPEVMMTDSKLNPTRWCNGLNNQTCYEWLVNVYRMRLDDGVQYGGVILGNTFRENKMISNSNVFASHVTRHFLFFLKLAVSRNIIPKQVDKKIINKTRSPEKQSWSWQMLLLIAKKLLFINFSKAQAIQKYGGENYFDGQYDDSVIANDKKQYGISHGRLTFSQAGMQSYAGKSVNDSLGKRSLRFTAQQIYKIDVYGKSFDNGTNENFTIYKKIYEQTVKAPSSRVDGDFSSGIFIFDNEELFEDVGGVDIWKNLYQTLCQNYDNV